MLPDVDPEQSLYQQIPASQTPAVLKRKHHHEDAEFESSFIQGIDAALSRHRKDLSKLQWCIKSSEEQLERGHRTIEEHVVKLRRIDQEISIATNVRNRTKTAAQAAESLRPYYLKNDQRDHSTDTSRAFSVWRDLALHDDKMAETVSTELASEEEYTKARLQIAETQIATHTNLLEEYRAVERELLKSVSKWAVRREAVTPYKVRSKSQRTS